MFSKNIFGLVFFSCSLILGSTSLRACPFCSATSQTLSQEMDSSDAVVLARLVKGALPLENGPDALGRFGVIDPDTGIATFEIYKTLKGEPLLKGIENIDVVFFGPPEKDKSFLITGIGAEKVDWSTPLPLSDKAVEYVEQLPKLPTEGAARLEFFQRYLENSDPLLRQDSYDEFARAPYDEVIALANRMDHDQLVEWISSSTIGPSRRRLYLTMLGACGDQGDLPMLEDMIFSDHREVEPGVKQLVQAGLSLGGPIALPLVTEIVRTHERSRKLGLDAMIACYVKLAGPEVLPAINERFLKDTKAEYTHTYNTLMALRFHGEETDVIPREQLLESVRLLLDHPDFADQVIPDLARWDDWEILDRLVAMFHSADDRSFVRQPIVTYLIVASEQEGDVGTRAKKALEELESLDPESVERARSLMAFGYLGRSRPSGDNTNYARQDNPDPEKEAASDPASPSADNIQTENAQEPARSTDTNTDVTNIPDPADPQFNTGVNPIYVGINPTTTVAHQKDTPQEEVSPNRSLPSEAKLAAPDGSDSTATVAAAPTPVTDHEPLSSVDSSRELDTPRPPNRMIILAIPLLAGALLMGLFWLLLKSGSV
jgi:hypothetical protein